MIDSASCDAFRIRLPVDRSRNSADGSHEISNIRYRDVLGVE